MKWLKPPFSQKYWFLMKCDKISGKTTDDDVNDNASALLAIKLEARTILHGNSVKMLQ